MTSDVELKVTRYEVDGRVAVITLDRPDRLNAWTARMASEVRASLVRAGNDDGIGAVVLTGAGRGFCAGADTDALGGLASGDPYERSGALAEDPTFPVPAEMDDDIRIALAVPKPVIAAVNGAAAGIGFVLMCVADVRIASKTAKLTTSFARLGLPAEHGVAWLLPRIVGAARAAELLMTSRVVLGEEAAAIGLVNKAVDSDEVLAEALRWAHSIAHETSPDSQRIIKQQLAAALDGSFSEACDEAAEHLRVMLKGDDFREGVDALRSKRTPEFPAYRSTPA